ncbi:hypothetical protein [Amycolatopsis sp. CA-230715]|uniref:hypothetical protein n=1 Tax=Amycolatopsis sp. CA-230715 TaxID=2745196 RepID=UPI001C027918|nr:hypothetical protein [Amycolatopsis sp. CA-230715]QWF76937.1 hypothetical protein HUW46_00317 [Amycolatopsis sp. CA-230715]
MSGKGFRADEATISAISAHLSTGADSLRAPSTPPPPVKAGRLTAVFAALGAELAGESEKLMSQFGGAAQAVKTAGESYAQVDDNVKRNLRPEYEKPGWNPGPVPPGTA